MNKNTFKQPSAQIIFGGCGGMYSYELGIASILQKEFDLNNVIYSAVSAGSFPATLMALNMDISILHKSWNLPFLKEVNSHYFGALGVWNNIVRKWTLPTLSLDAYKKCNSRLFLSMSSVNSFIYSPRLKNELISEWKSNEDLLDGIMASSFVPLFDIGKLTATFRNKRYIDGIMTDNCPKPFKTNDIPTLDIEYNMWRDMNYNWQWCWSSPEWHTTLYEWGREDTLKHLKDIEKILSPKTKL